MEPVVQSAMVDVLMMGCRLKLLLFDAFAFFLLPRGALLPSPSDQCVGRCGSARRRDLEGGCIVTRVRPRPVSNAQELT
eukprot:6189419-Pleurochrysis_carterae.AAC.1